MMSMSFMHPEDVALQRYAAGESDHAESVHVAKHVVQCSDCREHVEFARALRARAHKLESPVLPPDGLNRVLQARASGARTILPADVRVARPRLSSRTTAAIAAAVLFVAVGVVQTRRHGPEELARSESVPVLQASILGLDIARGNGFDVVLPGDPMALDGNTIQPGHWVFEYEIVSDKGQPIRERGQIDVTLAVLNDVSAWRITDQSLGHATDMVETTYVDRQTLRPLRRVAHRVGFSQYDVQQDFVHDSVVGVMSNRTKRIRIAHPLPPLRGPYAVGEGAPLLLLQAAPLTVGWTTSFRVVGWNAAVDDTTYAVRAEVIGEERITTSLGTVDAWVLDLTSGGRDRRFWLRKRDHVPVLSRNDKASRGMVRSATLVSESLVRQASP